MTQRVRALTAMAAGDEPNILRLWSARTQNHAVRGFMVSQISHKQVRLSRCATCSAIGQQHLKEFDHDCAAVFDDVKSSAFFET